MAGRFGRFASIVMVVAVHAGRGAIWGLVMGRNHQNSFIFSLAGSDTCTLYCVELLTQQHLE